MKRIILLEAILLCVIVLGAWLLGARTILHFSQALLWGGCVVMGLGMISLMGQWGARTDANYVIGRTVADQPEMDRAHRSFSDITASFYFLFETFILGGIPAVLGLVLNWLSR